MNIAAPVVLDSRQLLKQFGGITATDHVDFKLRRARGTH